MAEAEWMERIVCVPIIRGWNSRNRKDKCDFSVFARV